jgi:hypothetical protein
MSDVETTDTAVPLVPTGENALLSISKALACVDQQDEESMLAVLSFLTGWVAGKIEALKLSDRRIANSACALSLLMRNYLGEDLMNVAPETWYKA